MDEEYNIEDNILIFNSNFDCNDEEQIMDLYKTKQSVENNDDISKKIVKEKYNHPLLLNYNYCLFCLERRKTKYNQRNLTDVHDITNIKTIGDFLEKDQIKLQIPRNKIEKLSKRRFIHSSEPVQKKITELNQYHDSDTELYIEKEKDKEKSSQAINMLKKIRATIKFTKKLKSLSSKKIIKKKSSQQLSTSFEMNHNGNNIENTIDIQNDSIKITPNKLKLAKTYNGVISRSSHGNKPISKKNALFHSFTESNNNDKKKNEDAIIFNSDNKNLEQKHERNKSFSLFGFITNYFSSNKENENRNAYMEQINETEIQSFQYFEKNEKCAICLGEIKDKFTLFCGDFFCRECIINLIEEAVNNISLFDKIECPRCHEKINESTIKFLIKRETLEKYNKIKTRVEGLRNKNNVPCPHPDCEGFALKEEIINGTLQCQNRHIFCNKCLEEVSSKYRLEPNNIHKCNKKYLDNEKYLASDKNIRKCPQCKSWVERDPGGCNYFRCSNIWCKYEFCWICGNKYDPSHYRNPLSMCFGLSDKNYKGKMIKSIRVRRIRCILISLLFLLILLPIICIFFSFFSIISFVMYFQLDGKELRNVRFHSKPAHKVFYIFFALSIILISIGLIPFGYICLILLLLLIPILLIINKIKKKDKDDF